ncbi:DUF5695 domain-containing protein [Sphingomonas sp. KR1UV-12]|uniref:DUF5695 domain-containing protein n=1 Tax=Sphingomonas aurea TaxID=3063994 RepID=A0ABT9ELX6_9SPHN|nr:DUF5695 domain-containing protein [Sphingomonas sp. KR1UV-12]MDP1027949.1 DUF5695 domain-containing protein [Sphingomonas sp. KR1UV-12]
MRHDKLLPIMALTIAPLAAAAPVPQAAPRPAEDRYAVGAFDLALRHDTQTLARLAPRGAGGFDFVPSNRAGERRGDGYNHIGDVHVRLRTGTGAWRDFASANARRPIRVLAAGGATIARADITASMGAGFPLTVERTWVRQDGAPVLRITLANPGRQPVEVGELGLPMVFDNIISGRSLEQAHAQASFVDPYIGQDAGYLQVTRLNGKGPALLVLPEAKTPLEAYRILRQQGRAPAGDIFTDRSPREQTSEGFYDWMVASAGMAADPANPIAGRKGAPWNPGTSFTLAPGERRTVGVRFVAAPAIRAIEPTLTAQRRPVAIGIPGYVVPTDAPADLFVKAPQSIRSVAVSPADAMTLTRVAGPAGWARYRVTGSGWGRARVAITYADGSVQAVHYYVTKPLAQVSADLGRFATSRQWFDDKADPFGRAPAILTYDRQANRIVTQDQRVWIAGMSDEGGGGAWVAAAMKQLDHPEPGEVAKLERLIDETVVGKLQVADGAHAGGVKKSLFWYDPARFPDYYAKDIDWSTWASWKKDQADDLGRSYNYPHVAAGHWVLYRLARNHVGLVTGHEWRWYLDWAYRTTVAMMRDAPHYAQFGQMEGEVFLEILRDLKREGMTAQANEVEGLMRSRADHWRTLAYPFGSEMAWDSTGQPEVYAWMQYFGFPDKAAVTREVILGYDPTVPHWGYNGNARRYWDFLYGGKIKRIERQLHHYGSALNAVPLFDAYRRDPADLHLLRVAYGGFMGGITNVDREGFASAGFHSEPDVMDWDAMTGDYGMGYFGHAYAAATYLVRDPALGWLGFGGTVDEGRDAVGVVPHDGARTRLFVAPAGQWITLAAGTIARAEWQPARRRIVVTLDPATATTPAARLAVEAPAGGKAYAPNGGRMERGFWTIPLGSGATTVTLEPR